MSDIKIYLMNSCSLKPTIFINGKESSIKKQHGKSFIQLDSNQNMNLTIKNFHPLFYPFGMLISYLFFILSVFGIFDKRYKNKEKRMEVNIDISNISSDLKITFFKFQENGTAIQIDGDCDLQINNNIYYKDSLVRKKLRILMYMKLLTWILLIISLVFVTYRLIVEGHL